MTLEGLKAKAQAAEIAAREAKRAYETALCEEYPLKVGDIIKSSKGNLARVESVSVKWGSVRVFAVVRNKDGQFGKRSAALWHEEWNKPERVEL